MKQFKTNYYMYVKVTKPLSYNSKVIGKLLPIKEWVKQKSQEERTPVYTHPVFLSSVFDGEKFIEIYCREKSEFVETYKSYVEKIGA